MIAFGEYVGSRPAHDVTPRAWGPREVLAHIVYWHERYVEIIEAALAGREPTPLDRPYRELNALAVRTMEGESIGGMVLRLFLAQRKLELLAPRARHRAVRVAIKAGVKARSIDELYGGVEGHIRGHHAALRRESRRAA